MAKVSISLFFESEESSIEDISSWIGMEPNGGWRKGESRGATGKIHLTNAWKFTVTTSVIDAADPITDGIDAVLHSLLAKLEVHEKQVRDAARVSSAGILLSVSCGFIPPLIVKSSFLTSLSKLGLDLEIDVTTQ